jgi:hypothetical protein
MPRLAKSAANAPGPMAVYLPNGGSRVNLESSATGTFLQIFDLLGRQVYQNLIPNISKPESYIIPASDLPNGPTVAKIKNNGGSFIFKTIPVR